MKIIAVMIAILVTGIVGIDSAWAFWGHHDRFVVVEPFFDPPYYREYYYPPVVINRPSREIYIEGPASQVVIEELPAAHPSPVVTPSNDWYYCSASKKYYPYVKKCPGGWKKVPSKPPGEP